MSSFKVHSYAPDAYIKFFPFVVENTLKSNAKALETSIVTAKDDIMSVQTTKNKNGVGQWSAMLSPNVNYLSKIHPGCWCCIYISDEPLRGKGGAGDKASGLKMVGIVKSVRRVESLDPDSGTRTIRYSVAGEDFTSALNMPLYVNSTLAGEDQDKRLQLISLLYGKDGPQIVPPHELAKKLVDLIYGDGPDGGFSGDPGSNPKIGFQFSVPAQLDEKLYGSAGSDRRFRKFLKTNFQTNLIGKADVQPDLGGSITVWSLLKTYCNPILNELFCDLFPTSNTNLHPTLVLRAIPFNTVKGKPDPSCLNIRTTDNKNKIYISKEIEEHEILSLNYGKSDQERFNFFLAVPTQVSEANWADKSNVVSMIKGSGGLTKLADLKSITRYGLRPYVANSIYIVTDPDAFVQFNTIVRDMWSTSHLFDNGMMTLRGSRKHIPIGTNVLFKDRNWLAHVEGVSHSFSVEPGSGKKSFRTDIAFVRLQNTNGSPLHLLNKERQSDTDPGITDDHNGAASWDPQGSSDG